MKIHILTGHFTPQLHPRAFRASELAIEFVKRGHKVTVTNLTTVEGADYLGYTKSTGVEVRNLGYITWGVIAWKVFLIAGCIIKCVSVLNTFWQAIYLNSLSALLKESI